MAEACRTYGNTPYNIVLVHGGPGAVGEMAAVAMKLASDFGVVESLHRALTIHDQIGELLHVINKETTPPVYLIGFSWGAWLSILFTAEYSYLVKKLILIGCGPLEAKYAREIYNTRVNRLDPTDQKKFKTLLDSLVHQHIKEVSSAFDELSHLIEKTDSYDPVFSSVDKTDIHTEVFTSIWKEAEIFRKEGVLLGNLKQINIPIHGIHGDYDPHPAAGIINPLKQFKKDFQYEILKHCGHTPWIERQAQARFYEILQQNISDKMN